MNTLSVAPTWLWISFSIAIVVLLLIDLSLFKDHGPNSSKKKYLLESAMWVAISLIFNLWFSFNYGSELGIQFLTGYLVEKSLSVDNLFVILLIFSSFKIPAQYQHRVLFYGVLGAIVLRAIFILLGAQLLAQFHWILYIFGAILVVTAIKFLVESDKTSDVQDSFATRLLRKFIPTTKTVTSQNFFVIENGIRKGTPLLLALLVIEITDLIFAVDSIPAVFSITQDAFVAFASNILAVLGLRALYFVLADWITKLKYLKPGLAAILGFIGTKMLLMDFVKISSWVSLLVIMAILLTACLSSWYVTRNRDVVKTMP